MKDYKPLNIKKQWWIKRRAKFAKRRAKKFGAIGAFTTDTVVDLYNNKQNGRCACCGVLLKFYFEIDHIKPLSKGGDNTPENIQLLTPQCNSLKGDLSMDEYLRGRL